MNTRTLAEIRYRHPMMGVTSLLLLLYLFENGPITHYPTGAKAMKLRSPAQISRAEIYLEQRGYMMSRRIKSDGRRVELSLTEAGAGAAKAILEDRYAELEE